VSSALPVAPVKIAVGDSLPDRLGGPPVRCAIYGGATSKIMTDFVRQLTIFLEPIRLPRCEKSLGRQQMDAPKWYVLPTTILCFGVAVMVVLVAVGGFS
jgi:hypothetical protein